MNQRDEFLARAAHLSVIGLFLIGVFVALSLAQNVFAPVLTAIVVGFLLGPLADKAEKWRIPPFVIALVTVSSFMLAVAGLSLLLAAPILQLVDEAPRIVRKVSDFFEGLKNSLATLESVSEEIRDAMPGEDVGVERVSVENGGEVILGAAKFAPAALGNIVVFLGSLFFFILSRSNIYRYLVRHSANLNDQANFLELIRGAEKLISKYFAAITGIGHSPFRP